MKKILFLLLFLLCAAFANAQQTFKFGNVTMKDTASGSLNLKSGGLYTDFIYTTGDLTLYGDSGIDFRFIAQGNGITLYMDGLVTEFGPSAITLFSPMYLPQYSNSEISELSVSPGAMVINYETQEVWVYLDGQWKILDTK